MSRDGLDHCVAVFRLNGLGSISLLVVQLRAVVRLRSQLRDQLVVGAASPLHDSLPLEAAQHLIDRLARQDPCPLAQFVVIHRVGAGVDRS